VFTERKCWDPAIILQNLALGRLDEVLGCARGTVKKYFKTAPALIENLEWVWRQYSYEGKRHMLPPGFIRSPRAFGFDRRDTIADGYFTNEYLRLRNIYMGKTSQISS
jgi:NAD+ synthase (glutamine-hydrolysing)